MLESARNLPYPASESALIPHSSCAPKPAQPCLPLEILRTTRLPARLPKAPTLPEALNKRAERRQRRPPNVAQRNSSMEREDSMGGPLQETDHARDGKRRSLDNLAAAASLALGWTLLLLGVVALFVPVLPGTLLILAGGGVL